VVSQDTNEEKFFEGSMVNQRSELGSDRKIFLFLVAFRWASLLPAFWLVFRGQIYSSGFPPLAVLLVAIGNTVLISLFYRRLNRWLVHNPWLLGIDLLYTTGLLAISGGTYSPYYLYALSPLLAGAFFFQLRGAVLISAIDTILYLLALAFAQLSGDLPADPTQFFTQLAGIWLIPVLFSYPVLLLNRLRDTRDALAAVHKDLEEQNQDLARAHRQLEILHDLTVLLQAAPDLRTVQDRVLRAVTEELGFAGAAVGLVDPETQELGNWQVYSPGGSVPSAENVKPVPLSVPSLQPLLQHQSPVPAAGDDFGIGASFSNGLGLPLQLREHPVGVLFVALPDPSQPLSAHQQEMLRVVAGQAAVALGTTMVCIDRTRRLAVEQERNRIARDIHDTIAQSLFGMVFSLDACIDMLPGQSQEVKRELVELRELAGQVRNEVRRSIYDLWPAEITLERFKSDLSAYATQCCHPHAFRVDFNANGDFEALSPLVRRTLYRISQEALVNAARHGGVDSAKVCLGIEEEQVHLCIQDEGKGFDPQAVLDRDKERDRFGLFGIQGRIRALGGDSQIFSLEGQGTIILVSLPSSPGIPLGS
jgi:signal transduction histidine kinase